MNLLEPSWTFLNLLKPSGPFLTLLDPSLNLLDCSWLFLTLMAPFKPLIAHTSNYDPERTNERTEFCTSWAPSELKIGYLCLILPTYGSHEMDILLFVNLLRSFRYLHQISDENTKNLYEFPAIIATTQFNAVQFSLV